MMHLPSVRTGLSLACLLGCLLAARGASAQSDTPEATYTVPLDDITQRAVLADRQTLAYTPVREADILWEKRLWRVIDVREKINQPFLAPESPFFSIVADAALAGELRVYSTEDDRFTKPLRDKDLREILFDTDTIITRDVETDEEVVQIVHSEINWENVKRFRLKESWYFDTRTGSLRVRLLGIAPLIELTDENGDFKMEKPLFWVHYPSARPLLARHKAVVRDDNYAANTSWEDLFEMRYFSATVYKENNVHDRRLFDYLAGTDLLLEAERIDNELFNREHDMWTW